LYNWQENSGEDYQPHYICFKLCSGNDSIYVGKIIIDSEYVTKIKFLPIVYKNDVYVYLRYFNEETGEYSNEIWVLRKTGERHYAQAEHISNNKMYAPLVLTNCSSCYKDSGIATAMISKGAQQVEGFNLLGNYYKMEFSTFDKTPTGFRIYPNQDGDITDYYSFMEYSLPYTTVQTPGIITVEYVDKKGLTHHHSVETPTSAPTIEAQKGTDHYYLHAFIKGNIVHISFNYSEDVDMYAPEHIHIDDYVHNNMIVTAPCKNDDENWAKVMEMTEAIWYGNTSLGVNGGSRLFLGGNTEEKEKALVVWSDFDNPLYFSENNYAYVGDKSQKVTAFGRQGSSLIVFKEKEIYSCEYAVKTVNAQELMDQTAIDLVTQTANFTFALLHSNIGCDCPKSIQLCLNRLVWATTEGKVYTLTDRNQYSERNVFDVSLMIDRKLKKEDMSSCYSADWNGFYLLFCNNTVFAMNYNSNGYMSISSYTQNYEANQFVPWFIWQLPYKVEAVYSCGEKMVMVFIEETNHTSFIRRGYFDFETEQDYVIKPCLIESMAQTKIFDLKHFEKNKHISRVSVLIGNNKKNQVKIDCLNENGVTDTHLLTLNGVKVKDSNMHYSSKQIIPSIRLCQSFGMRFKSMGRLEIKGINISFKFAENVR